MTRASTSHFRAAGVGNLSADRGEEATLVLRRRSAIISSPGVSATTPSLASVYYGCRAIAIEAERALARLSVRYGRLSDLASSLSGGNQQRLAIARELIAAETACRRSADPRRRHCRNGFHPLADRCLSRSWRRCPPDLESLDEILALSDRIIGLYNGRIVGELNRDQASVDRVGRMMLGQKAA